MFFLIVLGAHDCEKNREGFGAVLREFSRGGWRWGETADRRISVRGAIGDAARAMRAVVRNGELRGPLWPGWRGFQRFSRVRSPLKCTAFRLAWRAGYSHPRWSATSRRYSHSPFGCTAFRPVFFVRARWCSPFECTGFGVARGGIYPHRDRSIRVDASDAHPSDSQTFESVDAQDVHIRFASRSDRQTRPRRACACRGGPGSGVLPGPPTALTVEMHSATSGLVGRISTSVVSTRMTPSVRVWTTDTPKDSNHCAFRR